MALSESDMNLRNQVLDLCRDRASKGWVMTPEDAEALLSAIHMHLTQMEKPGQETASGEDSAFDLMISALYNIGIGNVASGIADDALDHLFRYGVECGRFAAWRCQCLCNHLYQVGAKDAESAMHMSQVLASHHPSPALADEHGRLMAMISMRNDW